MVVFPDNLSSSNVLTFGPYTWSYRHYDPKTGKYGEHHVYWDTQISVVMVENDSWISFPDPQHLWQGGSLTSKRGTIENDVTHTKYVGSEPLEFAKPSWLPPGAWHSGSGNRGEVGTFTVTRKQFDETVAQAWLPNRDNVCVGSFSVCAAKFPDGGYVNALYKVWVVPCDWGDRSTAGIWVTTGVYDATDPDNVIIELPPDSHVIRGPGSKSFAPCERPLDSRVKAVSAEWMHKCELFGRMVDRAISGDVYTLRDTENVANRALEQLDASQSSDVNWIENIGDMVGVALAAKDLNGRTLLKKFKRIRTNKSLRAYKAQGSISFKDFDRAWYKTMCSYSAGEFDARAKWLRRNNYLTADEYKRLLDVTNPDGSFKPYVIERIADSSDRVGDMAVIRGSDAWLWYRYVYCTTMMDANALCSGSYSDTVAQALVAIKQWQHVHATVHSDLLQSATETKIAAGTHQFSTWALPDISNAVQQAVIDNQSMGLLSASNLWDIVPFSFVVDWFTGIGDFLGRLDNVIGIAAAHYEYACSIDTWTISDGTWHCYARRCSPGCVSYSLNEQSKYSPSERTKFKRATDLVAMYLKSRS